MSATISYFPIGLATPVASPLRFGRESDSGERSVQWLLKRNCSATPRQALALFGSLCLVSLLIAAVFWFQGATLVMPFAWAELAALAVALLLSLIHI